MKSPWQLDRRYSQILNLENRRIFFWRILGEQRQKRGESENRARWEERFSPRAQLALHARLAFASIRLLCSPKIRK